jgi:hypothetical protein
MEHPMQFHAKDQLRVWQSSRKTDAYWNHLLLGKSENKKIEHKGIKE